MNGMKPIATRNSWSQVIAMPEQRAQLSFGRTFTASQFAALARGLVPEQMEDKWFIFLEDDHLYFHRSWTGHCIFKVRIFSDQNAYQVAETWVNRDSSQYRSPGDEFDITLIGKLLDNLLLSTS